MTYTQPSTTELALLQAIMTKKDDDVLRGAYADEIESTQPEWAEFIRVQCELSREPRDAEGRYVFAGLAEREGDLRDRERRLFGWWNVQQWFRKPDAEFTRSTTDEFEYNRLSEETAPSTGISVAFIRRGFIHSVTCTASDWLRIADSLTWCPAKCEKCRGTKWTNHGGWSDGVSYHSDNRACDACAGSGRVPPTVACPGCEGTGAVERLDSGIMRRFGLREWDGCPVCGSGDSRSSGMGRADRGSGRIPRPLPPTAQPIEHVKLTGFDVYEDEATVLVIQNIGDKHGIDGPYTRCQVKKILEAEWYGIEFELNERWATEIRP